MLLAGTQLLPDMEDDRRRVTLDLSRLSERSFQPIGSLRTD